MMYEKGFSFYLWIKLDTLFLLCIELIRTASKDFRSLRPPKKITGILESKLIQTLRKNVRIAEISFTNYYFYHEDVDISSQLKNILKVITLGQN